MKQKYHLVFWIIALISLVLINGCVQETKTLDGKINICEELSMELDKNIVGTNNPPNNFVISGFEGGSIVGGYLIEISEPWHYTSSDEEQGKITYTMTFRGLQKEGKLYLITSRDAILPYEIGEFYKFDLGNINKYSMQLSGAFIDFNLNALERLNCS